MAITLNQPLKNRFLHRDEAGVKPLTDAQIAELNKSFNLTEDLGILVNENGTPEMFSGSTKSVPRVFFTTPRANMSDAARSAGEAGIEIGSKEFWRQVQLGNVFVYPVGQKGPSQLQVSVSDKGEPEVAASIEITNGLSMPKRKIEKPGIFKRIFSFLSSKWREQVRSYDNQLHSTYEDDVKEHLDERTTERLNKEKKSLEEAKENKAKAEYMKAHSANHLKVEEKHANTKDYDNNVDLIFGTKPAPKKSWEINLVDDTINGGKTMDAGHATKDNFEKLEKYDIRFDQINSKTLKKPFDEQDFTTLSFYTTQDKDLLKAYKQSNGSYDEAVRQAQVLQNCGLNKEDAEFLALNQGANAAFSDYYGADPRAHTGNSTIPNLIQPARQKTKEAFEAYAKGDKTKMAGLIASAVKQAAFEHCRMSVSEGSKTLGDKSDAGMALQTAKLSELIDKDPELADIARKQFKMKDEDLKLVQGMGEYKKLDDARTAAQEKLTLAEMRGEKLSEQEKQDCIKDIVKADLATQIIVNQQAILSKNEENAGLSQKINETTFIPQNLGFDKDGHGILSTMPDDKLNQSDAFNYSTFTVPALLNKRPEFIQNMKADSQQLEDAAKEIMKQDKLYQEGMTEQNIFEKIDNHIYSADGMKKAGEIMMKKGEPQAQKAVGQPAISINDRRNMFEPQKGGPTA